MNRQRLAPTLRQPSRNQRDVLGTVQPHCMHQGETRAGGASRGACPSPVQPCGYTSGGSQGIHLAVESNAVDERLSGELLHLGLVEAGRVFVATQSLQQQNVLVTQRVSALFGQWAVQAHHIELRTPLNGRYDFRCDILAGD